MRRHYSDGLATWMPTEGESISSHEDKKTWKELILPEVKERYRKLSKTQQGTLPLTSLKSQEPLAKVKKISILSYGDDDTPPDVLKHENANLKQQLGFLRKALQKMLQRDRSDNLCQSFMQFDQIKEPGRSDF